MNLFGLTDTGAVRRENQDSYAIRELNDQMAVAVVCDGMGGARAGNVASAVAVETFTAAVEDFFRQRPPQNRDDRLKMMRIASQKANRVVFELSESTPEYQGMGTTLVGALILPEEFCLVNIGDSRAYIIRENTIKQITQDHSLVQVLVARGELTQEQARVHPKKNLITRALGVDNEVQGDVFWMPACSGDRLLLCSDGLSNVLSDQQLLDTCRSGDAEVCCRQLMAQTLKLGAPDNVTVIMAQL